MSQATTTLLRFFAFDSDGLGASSGLAAFELAAAQVALESEAAFERFFCEAAEGAEGELDDTAAPCGDDTGRADVDAVTLLLKLAPDAGVGEFSKGTLERPLRIETSSKAT